MANLIVCCDGTWNTPDDRENGLPAPTNVVKLYNSLAALDDNGIEQKHYYHPGVGTDGNWWERIAGGGLGRGLERNVKSAYRWLAGAYRPGDHIWLFGFSRGAYTARSVGGMISRCGLLDPGQPASPDHLVWKHVDALFDAYRVRKTLPVTAGRRFHNVTGSTCPEKSTPIHFIGVWDTVGALGIPADLALLHFIDDPARHEFHDTMLSPIVQHARHAVAIDERRDSFTPTLWAKSSRVVDLKQIWFAGVHGDVGGGYGQSGLSDIALGWMMNEARDQNLAIRPKAQAQLSPSAQAPLHDSLTGVFARMKTRPRAVPVIPDVAGKPSSLHRTVVDRHRMPPISQGRYWPRKLVGPGQPAVVDVFARQHWNASGIFLEAGGDYAFSAKGEWLDGSVVCDPEGTKGRHFQYGEIWHFARSLIDDAEDFFKGFSGKQQADFWWSRREGALPWFALVGVVANSTHWPDDKHPNEHEVFLIGEETRFTPKASGYLYAFANDAWQNYDDNAGSVSLTVSLA